jgi:hypothetical protein
MLLSFEHLLPHRLIICHGFLRQKCLWRYSTVPRAPPVVAPLPKHGPRFSGGEGHGSRPAEHTTFCPKKHPESRADHCSCRTSVRRKGVSSGNHRRSHLFQTMRHPEWLLFVRIYHLHYPTKLRAASIPYPTSRVASARFSWRPALPAHRPFRPSLPRARTWFRPPQYSAVSPAYP